MDLNETMELMGYFYCHGCGDYHRAPVADDPHDPCPVDVNRVAWERAERDGLGTYGVEPGDVEEARRRRSLPPV